MPISFFVSFVSFRLLRLFVLPIAWREYVVTLRKHLNTEGSSDAYATHTNTRPPEMQ